MESVITSYTNPDLDGVACAIVLAAVDTGQWTPRVAGEMDEETKVVLNSLGLAHPQGVSNWDAVGDIWLVDTHHPAQLPAGLPTNRVTRITDHHVGGTPSAFPNAQIQNEVVGAAATLVFERCGSELSPLHALLLQCAIISNTLGFRAPATCPRDHRAFKALKGLQPLSEALRHDMRAARRVVLKLDTPRLVRSDIKRFETRKGVIVVGQVEAEGAMDVIKRHDLGAALRCLADAEGAFVAVMNIVDTERSQSAIVTTVAAITTALSTALGVPVNDAGIIVVDRLLQRKSDVVPFLPV